LQKDLLRTKEEDLTKIAIFQEDKDRMESLRRRDARIKQNKRRNCRKDMNIEEEEENERIKKKLLLKKLNDLRKKEKLKKEIFIKENSRNLTVIPERNLNDINRSKTIKERLPKIVRQDGWRKRTHKSF